jgi:hypothetical protein
MYKLVKKIFISLLIILTFFYLEYLIFLEEVRREKYHKKINIENANNQRF